MKPDFQIDLARIVLATAVRWVADPATGTLSHPFFSAVPECVTANGGGQLVVQIVGRVCHDQRHHIKAT